MSEREEWGRSEYRQAFERLAESLEVWLERVRREAAEAPALLAELLREPAPVRRERIRRERRFQSLKLCERLQGASREAWADDPAQAVELAELAVEVSERLALDPGLPQQGMTLIEDARALAWAYLGNACRIASDLRRAERALARAEVYLRRLGLGMDPLTEAEVLGFQASLCNTQGRFDEAGRLLDRAIVLYREAGDSHLEGRCLILKGMVLGDAGQPQMAIRTLRLGLARIEPDEEPRLLLAAWHNLLWYLNDGGRHREARELLEASRALYLELGDRMHLVRLRWLEGRIALGLGRLDEAEAALRLARDAFAEREIGFDAALASLDLALVHARRGEAAEVKRIAAEILPIFQASAVHPEALAALRMFQEAAEAERVTAGLVERIADCLQRARRRPGPVTSPDSLPGCGS